MQPAPRTPAFQKVINALVIVLVANATVNFAWDYLPYFYGEYDYYSALPDEVSEIDDVVFAALDDVPSTPELFKDGYANKDIWVNLRYSSGVPRLSAADIYAEILPSIVYVNTANDYGDLTGFGSGTVISSNGVILTNYHVVEGADRVMVSFSDQSTYPVVDVVAVDPVKDIALLKIDAEGLPTVALANSDKVRVGDTTYAIGHPENLLFTLSEGIVSGIRDFVSTGEGKQFQVTNSISSGNSGGALLNDRGQLIGIPASVFEYEDNIVQVQNLNFAVPINSVVDLIERE